MNERSVTFEIRPLQKFQLWRQVHQDEYSQKPALVGTFDTIKEAEDWQASLVEMEQA